MLLDRLADADRARLKRTFPGAAEIVVP